MARTGETYTQASAALTEVADQPRGGLIAVAAYDVNQARQLGRRNGEGRARGPEAADEADVMPSGTLLRGALAEASGDEWQYTDAGGHRYAIDVSRFRGLDPDDTYLHVSISYPSSGPEGDSVRD